MARGVAIPTSRRAMGVRFPSALRREFPGDAPPVRDVADLIATGPLDTGPVLTHRLALTSINEALDTAVRGDAIKVAIVS
ncbi:hypothetical protein [Aureimonas sp. AU4]|uniref:hypothetical protein n=1 Tax=Aureimonas sp. AU4 TaxID=1638163 RepID=UPI0007865DF0|nr:hypothetical protein [Aureimonas sp. AU4]